MAGYRTEIDLEDGEGFDRILISHPIGSDQVTVYHPPLNGEKAWNRAFANVADAEAYAIGLAAQNGQPVIPYTRDKLRWWLPERMW